MKKTIVAILVVVMVVGIVFSFTGCKDKDPVATSYVSMDINPSVELVLDENDNVISYSCENEDALLMLYGENIIGLNIEKASEKIINLAIEFGYLTEDNCGVQVNVASDKSKVETNILDKIGVVVEKAEGKLTFEVNYNREGSFVLNYELAKLKEKHPDEAAYQNLTAGKLEVINSALACDWTLTMDEAVTMSTSELLAIVNNAYSQLENYSTKAFELAKAAATAIYDEAVITAEDGIYVAKYAEFKGKESGVIGGIEAGLAITEYGTVRAAARGLEALTKSLTVAKRFADEIMASAEAEAIADVLEVDLSELEDSEGNVTVDSIAAYIDKLAKNATDNATDHVSEKLQLAVEKLEAYKDETTPLANEEISEVQSLLTAIKGIVEGIELPERMTLDDLKEISVKLNEYASEKKQVMDESLTKEQKEEIAEAQKNAVDKLTSAYDVCMNAISEAEETAKAHLQTLREQRLEYLESRAA